jgi:hypothetical protein
MDRRHRAPSRRVSAWVALALLLGAITAPAAPMRGAQVRAARQSFLQSGVAIGRPAMAGPHRAAVVAPSVDQSEVRDERGAPRRDAVPVRAVRVISARPAHLPAPPLVAGKPQYLRI